MKNIFAKSPESYSPEDYSIEAIDPATTHVLDHWISTLPLGLSSRVLDLAAGIGIESKYMSKRGLSVSAFDKNANVMRNMVFNVQKMDLGNLRLEKRKYSGALIKDAWIFFNEEERLNLLRNLHGALVNNGSVLIISQIAHTMAHILLHDSNNPIKVYSSEHSSEEEWVYYVNTELTKGGTLIDVEYDMNQETLENEARETGFTVSIDRFGAHDALAVNNRWKQYFPGFIARFTK